MNKIPCKLYCYTRWGSQCFSGKYDSMADAKRDGEKMKRDGYAFSYHIVKLKKKENGEANPN